MQCGFAFLEAGAVRSKNVVNILIKNVLDCFLGAIIYWAVGFAFAYGDMPDKDSSAFIGSKYFFSIYHEEYENYRANWFFQFVFAATASTIVSGAVAERTQFGSYLIYSTFITAFKVYPVVSHWGWSNTGWLTASKITSFRTLIPDCTADFAGSGLVHCCGGIAALVGAVFIGPRVGKFETVGGVKRSNNIPGHSVPVASLGAFILFLGFLAFNGGSVLAIVDGKTDNGEALAKSVMNTIIGGAAGSIFAISINLIVAIIYGEPQYWSLLVCINGGLAGMVSMCAACDALNTGAAFGIGAIAGLTLFWVSTVLKKFQVDDPLDAFAVHYGGGVCGILLSPIFAEYGIASVPGCVDQEDNFLETWNAACPANQIIQDQATNIFECDYYAYKQWTWNLIGLLAITAWTGAICIVMFGTLWYFDLLRVELDVEIRGLDIKKHGEPGYPTAAYGHGWDEEGSAEAATPFGGLGNAGGDLGRRDVQSLMGTPGFYERPSDGGLLSLAQGYMASHYKKSPSVSDKPRKSLQSQGEINRALEAVEEDQF
ncbi:unnamed protein product [Oikopleura dioica]|uniref:Ammonium transporter AmtB-like domain-containing protein n=1 Tax=Oikopleura dioica TaxID=34765 RepID=E4YDV2_OIKDI|nr:unnamed protein product [Oikopleura dioica]